MLEFFRRYQRYFFLVVTVILIASFAFFGTYGTFDQVEEAEDWAVSKSVSGSTIMFSEVQKLSRFIASDRMDSFGSRGLPPNLCNDGVIRNDLLKDRIGDVIVSKYFDALKGDFEARLDVAKRYRHYAHPQAPEFLNAKNVWNHFAPEISQNIDALKQEESATPKVFYLLKELYLSGSQLNPEMLRQILIHQHKQCSWLSVDQTLTNRDLGIFGFHSASDWFGNNFVDLAAEFILNAASAAYEKGYRVSLVEAKGDLIHHFQESLESIKRHNPNHNIHFHEHLRSLGFDEKSAVQCWQKVLLFRKYFRDVGEAAFVDRMPYREFSEYANSSALVEVYKWPIQIQSSQDLAEFKFYLKAISENPEEILPTGLKTVSEVEKKYPELVRTRYKAQVAEVSKDKLALKIPVKELWSWQTEEKNWKKLKKEFSLEAANDADERFLHLNSIDPNLRAKIDAFSRFSIVDEHPEWIEVALDEALYNERSWDVYGNSDPIYSKKDTYTRIKDLQIVEDRHILPYKDAKRALAKYVGKVETEYQKEKNPLLIASDLALDSVKSNPTDSRWVADGEDPLLDQFRLTKISESILRTSKEGWMKDEAFMMLPNQWSPVHLAEDGEIVFFYLQERKADPAPILQQISVGKETLAADAKHFFAEKFLETVFQKQAIVIPVQKEDE